MPKHDGRLTDYIPRLDFDTLGLMFVSGFFATIAFDLWGQINSPALGFANLSPHGLAKSLLSNIGLPSSNFAAYFVYFYPVGSTCYPAGWLFVFASIWNRTVGPNGWLIPAVIFRVGLWVFAIGGIAYIAGLPFFLNFTGIVWVAGIGHVLYAVVLVLVLKTMVRKHT